MLSWSITLLSPPLNLNPSGEKPPPSELLSWMHPGRFLDFQRFTVKVLKVFVLGYCVVVVFATISFFILVIREA